MANIVGGVTSINNPRTNWAQTDKTKADFLKNKPSVANALKGTANGEAIVISDASPIEHEMGVKVSGVSDISTVKVKKLGKNIIPFPYYHSSRVVGGVEITINEDGTITYNGTATQDFQLKLLDKSSIILGKNAILSGCPVGGNVSTSYAIQAQVKDVNGNYSYPTDTGSGAVIPKGFTIDKIYIQMRSGAKFDSLTFAPQIEYGTSASEYEPYNIFAEYPVSVDGTVEGVTPIYPTTTLVTDTAGAVIDCTYNRDANKVITDLETKLNTLIATIGG